MAQSTTARAVRVDDDRNLVVEDVEQQPLGEGEVRLAVNYCGICGSDLHLRPSPDILPAGSIMGHEISARVAEVGPGVQGFAEGDRVCVFPAELCGVCEFCRADQPQLCVQIMATGIGLGGRDGGYAELMTVPATTLIPIPDTVSDRDAALVEPISVALHIIDKAPPGEDDPVAVIGGGPIGALVALCLRALGTRRLVVLERNAERAERLRAAGLQVVEGGESVHERVGEALGGPPAIVYEAAGHPSAPQLAVELVAPAGIIVLGGVLLEPVSFNQLVAGLKEVQMRGAIFYHPRDFERAIELLAEGKLPADALVTDVVPLDGAKASFAELETPGTGHLKIMLEPSATA
jgi:(R,R)-butanediol dehydrogenase/meso-butanediol dehydrogenase/diacetyl reductase